MRTPSREIPVAVALLGMGVGIIALARGPAVTVRSEVKEKDEAYLLPPPEQLEVLSLGYRSALADYLWADVLVTSGLRLGEKRRFASVTSYLTAITELDPSFRDPFRLADSLTTVQAKSATLDDIRAVRRILEKGVEHHPNDAELWLGLGEFVTYIAPGTYFPEGEEKQRWKVEGARYLARAAELGAFDENTAWRAVGGARHLVNAGEKQAAIRFYRRALAVTEDEELRAHLLAGIRKLEGEAAVTAERARRARLEEVWRTAYPTMSYTALMMLTPPFDPAACAGGAASPHADETRCATTWGAWKARVDEELAGDARLDAQMRGTDTP